MFLRNFLKILNKIPLKNGLQFGTSSTPSLTLFERIVNRSIPANIIYEDERSLAFEDINPQAPVHFLVIPKKLDGLTQLSMAKAEQTDILGHLLFVCQKVAKEKKLDNGFRIVINNGAEAGQTVFHLHLHVMGGKIMGWPPL